MSAAVLNRAAEKKDDEFFTPFSAIVRELIHYKGFLRDKKILCPCRDLNSAFEAYFADSRPVGGCSGWCSDFASCVAVGEDSYRRSYLWSEEGFIQRDVHEYCFFSEEERVAKASYDDSCGKELLGDCDVVVTNPPFSKIRHFIQTIVEAGKDFIIVAPITAIGNKVVGNYLVEGKLRVGYTRIKEPFFKPDGTTQTFGNCVWFTSFPVLRNSAGKFEGRFSDRQWLFYDDIFPSVIYVPRLKDIPMDYPGIMAVPLTYLQHHDDRLFEIMDGRAFRDTDYGILNGYGATVGGKHKFTRVMIRRKK